MRNNRYRNYEKPQWEIEKERIEREEQEAIKKGLENTEENFPTLGEVKSVKNVSWGGRKFTELASEWKATEDERKEDEERQKNGESVRSDGFVMPQFRPSHHFVETEEDDGYDPIVTPSKQVEVDDDESGWTRIDNTAKKQASLSRRQARMDEKLRRYDEGEEPQPANADEYEEDESCWNNGMPAAPVGKAFDN